MKVLLIDDIDSIRMSLSEMITEYCKGVTEITEANNIESGIKAIESVKPDIVFIDVELGDGTAMDLLQHFKKIDFRLIFITAHNKYAIDAFKFSAVDFLLKPIHSADLVIAYEKAKNLIEKENLTEQFQILVQHLQNKNDSQKIVLRNSDAIHFVHINEIIRCEAEGSYTKFIVKNLKPILISKGLKEFDKLLEPFGFIRTHSSHLINPNHIIKFDKADGGFLVMENNDQVPVSTRKKETILNKLLS